MFALSITRTSQSTLPSELSRDSQQSFMSGYFSFSVTYSYFNVHFKNGEPEPKEKDTVWTINISSIAIWRIYLGLDCPHSHDTISIVFPVRADFTEL